MMMIRVQPACFRPVRARLRPWKPPKIYSSATFAWTCSGEVGLQGARIGRQGDRVERQGGRIGRQVGRIGRQGGRVGRQVGRIGRQGDRVGRQVQWAHKV